MKNIIYIITGCLVLGIGTIKAFDTITEANLSKAQAIKQTEINDAKDKIDYVKEMYLKCLEHFECGECTEHYEEVKNAYNNLNEIKGM